MANTNQQLLAALAAIPDSSQQRITSIAQRQAEVAAHQRQLVAERKRLYEEQRLADRRRQRIVDRLRGLDSSEILGVVAQPLTAPAPKAKG